MMGVTRHIFYRVVLNFPYREPYYSDSRLTRKIHTCHMTNILKLLITMSYRDLLQDRNFNSITDLIVEIDTRETLGGKGGVTTLSTPTPHPKPLYPNGW